MKSVLIASLVTLAIAALPYPSNLAAQQSEASPPASRDALIDLDQRLWGDYRGREELWAVDETVELKLEGSELVVIRRARKRWIGTTSNEIAVSNVLRIFRAELTDISTEISIDTYWLSFFRSYHSGNRYGSVLLNCREGECVTFKEQSVTTCLAACNFAESGTPVIVTKTTDSIHIPAAGAGAARHLARRLGAIIAAAVEIDQPVR